MEAEPSVSLIVGLRVVTIIQVFGDWACDTMSELNLLNKEEGAHGCEFPQLDIGALGAAQVTR